jgi:Antibiotic biosynthesis monooxygenase
VYARSTRVDASPDQIDAGIAHLRDKVMPAVMDMDGCVGMSLIVDRGSAHCIATTSWENEEAMRAAESRVESIRNDAARQFGGSVQMVERWEIAAMHREHQAREGSGVRCTWLRLPDVDRGIDAFKTRVLPRAEEMDGFCSGSFFVDRTLGRAVSAIAWDTTDAMDRSRDQIRQLRESVMADLGGEVLDVMEFELAIAHLRLPELV